MIKSNDGAEEPASGWRRWLARFVAFEDSFLSGVDAVQERRIRRLEADVAELRALLGRELPQHGLRAS